MNRDVIIACDFPSRVETEKFLSCFDDKKLYLKIGMELFYFEGVSYVSALKDRGHKIFLDLKLHDIPTTVERAMRNLSSIGVDMTNVHAAGGIDMMKRAKDAFGDGLLIAVTQLTSTSQKVLEEQILIERPIDEVVKIYAENAKKASLDGIVCSPHEAQIAKELGLISVTPGIRLAGDSIDDQKRISTPAFAKENGANFIVVGRSITAADDPYGAYMQCVEQFC